MLTLAGMSALIVGTRRVGAVVARRLAAEGVRQAIGYRGARTAADALAHEVMEAGPDAAAVHCDLGDEQSIRQAVDTAMHQFGGLDFVVNMASDYPRSPLASADGKSWDRAMVAARGAFLLNVYASRAMASNQGPTRGHLLHFGDWAAMETPYTDYLAYLTAKAAIHFMTRGFALELAGQGILVNAIAPGPTMRPPEIDKAAWDAEVVEAAPLKRESSANEIAEMVVALLRSETITGETIRIDSGRHIAGNPLPAKGP